MCIKFVLKRVHCISIKTRKITLILPKEQLLNILDKVYPFFQIMEIDGDEVEVICMDKKGSFYAWSSVQETSWDKASAIKNDTVSSSAVR